MASRECEMGILQSIPSSGMHALRSGRCTAPWGPLLAPGSSYGLVQQGGHILFLVPVGRAEHHHSILREREEMIK